MNSRQRRKIAAEKHNMLRVEEEAYLQDRHEDPKKYERKEKIAIYPYTAAMILAATLGYGL